jgi:hypothetical protein
MIARASEISAVELASFLLMVTAAAGNDKTAPHSDSNEPANRRLVHIGYPSTSTLTAGKWAQSPCFVSLSSLFKRRFFTLDSDLLCRLFHS